MAQTTSGLNNPIGSGAGVTSNFKVSYDNSLSQADGQDRANALLAVCDGDYAWVAQWFGGAKPKNALPIGVQIGTSGNGGAGWQTGANPTVITLNPANGTTIDLTRYLLISEVTEVFMQGKANGWGFSYGDGNEGVKGEALSRFLAYQFLLDQGLSTSFTSNYEIAFYWLAYTNPVTGLNQRLDYLGQEPSSEINDNAGDAYTGCAILFLYYLYVQLGFSIEKIVSAGSSTMKGVFLKLTGDDGDPFPFFARLIASQYPAGRYITTGNQDNPFPIIQQMQITCIQKPVSTTDHIGEVGGTNHTFNEVFSILQPECIALITGKGINRGKYPYTVANNYRFYVTAGGSTADVGVFYHEVPSANNEKITAYIATVGDRTTADNLLSLPEC